MLFVCIKYMLVSLTDLPWTLKILGQYWRLSSAHSYPLKHGKTILGKETTMTLTEFVSFEKVVDSIWNISTHCFWSLTFRGHDMDLYKVVPKQLYNDSV